MVLKPNTIGTGFGIANICSNVGNALTPLFQKTLLGDTDEQKYQGIIIV